MAARVVSECECKFIPVPPSANGAYLKKTFSVLKNEKPSRNMRSLINNLNRDDIRRKLKMRRRKKQVLISSNLKDNSLFLLKAPNVESQKLSNFGTLLANPLFEKNFVESHTRSPDGIDLNTIDKTDAQIVGALYNPTAQNEHTDESSSSTQDPSTQPATSENTDILFNLNQIPSNVQAPAQSGYYSNSDYIKSYLENIKMVPVYPIGASPAAPNSQQIYPSGDVSDIIKRCSTKQYQSSQSEGLYNIFSDIYKNLKMNVIITTAPTVNHNKEVNLLNSKYGTAETANEPNGASSNTNIENQYQKILNPEVMNSIMFSIKSIIENQNKKLNKCNSNLPKSYENVLTPQLMSLMLNSMANTISQPTPPAESLNSNDYLERFISRATTENPFLEQSYRNKLPRFDWNLQLENNDNHFDLNSLLKIPEKNKEFMYTNSPKFFRPYGKLFTLSSITVDPSTTSKEKIIARKVIPTKNNIGLHAIQPKLSIFSNLNFLKRCDNKSGENDTNSKTNEKEAFNTSSAIEAILKIVQEMRNREKQLSEDVNCNILGSWSSMAGGMLLIVTTSKDILDVTLEEKSPPGKKGFLMDPGWIIKGVQPIPKTNLIILTGTNLNSKHVIVFIGECRVCGGSELVTGNWLIGRCSHNCQDQKASQDLLSDVWRREMLTKLVHDRLKAMSTTSADTGGIKETTTIATTEQPSNATTRPSNEPTTDQNLDTDRKTTNELETKDQKSETTCNGNGTEEDLNFLFSTSATTVALGATENNNSSQTVEEAHKTTTISDSNSTKIQRQSGNKIFTLCNLNSNGATTKKTKKPHKIKSTTTTCEETTTENCSSSPSTSSEESSKTTDSNKCMVELDKEKSTTKPKFLNKVIHIFKNKSKTTTEK